MEELTEGTTAEEGGGNVISMFAELPPGVQRLIIAVIVVLVLIVLAFLQRLIRTEEAVSEDTDVLESMEGAG
ncbi:MAG: hypothetical protein R3293_08705 [Candidatus Promineifilaceae bacterium]|nr:hypothetical protein [Candidatus Promineifilaceae bacterium]